jgi:hypothetical protein
MASNLNRDSAGELNDHIDLSAFRSNRGDRRLGGYNKLVKQLGSDSLDNRVRA